MRHTTAEPEVTIPSHVKALLSWKMEVPLLTEMVRKSRDVDLIPDVHVEFLYPFKTDSRLIILPPISSPSHN